jgi:mono/diheme cytochrome c family protein
VRGSDWSSVRRLGLAAAVVVAGCGASPDGAEGARDGAGAAEVAGADAGDGGAGGDGGADAGGATGEELYAKMCSACHGKEGQGRLGPALGGLTDLQALTLRIDLTMPAGQAERCVGVCAERVAAYIIDAFREPPPVLDCSAPRYPPRRLRLLSRREYARTVRDLLWPTVACAGAADCALGSESCVDGECRADACGLHTFVFDPGGATFGAVHVAGSFNGWAATAPGGGWPLTWDAGAGVWWAKRELGPGEHSYKFVADGQWLADASNPQTAPDGFGGQNSVVTVACGAAAVSPSVGEDLVAPLIASFPPESRPDGFGYDTHAAAALATAVHVDAWLEAATALADAVAQRPERLLPCAAGPACAEPFVVSFGRRAFRRPLTPDEVARYRAVVDGAPSFALGVRAVVEAMLVSPHFLYRSELGQPSAGGRWRLDGFELASALSYMFWGTMPDDALLAAAADGRLDAPASRRVEAQRLLADPRARETMEAFASQWLGVDHVTTLTKQEALFGAFDPELRLAMLSETQRFVSHVVFDGTGRYPELLTAAYTLAGDRLRAHYGLPASGSDDATLVAYPDDRRAGLLGHASVLATTAHSDQTSPIRRGLFVRRAILCQELPPPPPNAGGVPDVDPDATTRERFAQHTADPFCQSCHQYIDDVGFGFERFDPVGRWRESDGGLPIDDAGDMNDVDGLGTATSQPYHGVGELAAILSESDTAAACFATQAYRFAMGRLDETADRCGLDAIRADFVAGDLDIRELLVAIATSDVFALRDAAAEAP